MSKTEPQFSNAPRVKKASAYNADIIKEANAIAERMYDYTTGTRCLILLQRNKDTPKGEAHPHHNAIKFISTSPDEYIEGLCKLLDKHYQLDNTRIYASCNERNIDKAIRTFKTNQLDNDYADESTHRGFYCDIENRFFSALMKPQSKADNKMIIDVDDVSIMDTVDKLVAELDLTVYTKYATKNGWHLVVAPFNPTLWELEGTNIKKDSLILLKY